MVESHNRGMVLELKHRTAFLEQMESLTRRVRTVELIDSDEPVSEMTEAFVHPDKAKVRCFKLIQRIFQKPSS